MEYMEYVEAVVAEAQLDNSLFSAGPAKSLSTVATLS